MLPMGLQAFLKWRLMIPDQFAAMQHMGQCGFRPRVVLDIGAYVGKFAKMTRSVWPDARIVMFEPQPDKQAMLQALATRLGNTTLMPSLLGERAGVKVQFHLHESGSSMKTFKSDEGTRTIELTTTTLDESVAGTPFEQPDLIKIDVQGAEKEVIAGGMRCLGRAQAVILEVPIVEEYEGAPLFHDVVAFMAAQGFRVYDLCTIWRNSRNKSMIEADLIFARPQCPIFDPKNYWEH